MVKFALLIPAALTVSSVFGSPADFTETAARRDRLTRRQINFIGQFSKPLLNPKGGKVPDPPGATSKFVQLPPRVNNAASKTIKVRYGPYKVPNMNVKNVVGEEGTLWNYPDNAVKKPCDDCYIVGINAGLEWPNGKNANINEGMWLHHMVLLSVGPGRRDSTCAQNSLSLPHLIVGSSPQNSERFFSSGNERTMALLPNWNIHNVGYKVKSTDQFALIVDLMNDTEEDQVVYMTITYDIMPTDAPGMTNMKPVWFDVAQCLTSDYPALKQDGAYQLTAPSWKADFDGDILGMAGHLHDGGQNVTIWADDKLVCTSTATYGGSPEYTSIHEHPKGSATEHISKMSLCINDTLNVKELKKGQKWVLKADYDYNRNKGDLYDTGKQETVMGIAIMYVKEKS